MLPAGIRTASGCSPQADKVGVRGLRVQCNTHELVDRPCTRCVSNHSHAARLTAVKLSPTPLPWQKISCHATNSRPDSQLALLVTGFHKQRLRCLESTALDSRHIFAAGEDAHLTSPDVSVLRIIAVAIRPIRNSSRR